MNKVLLPNNCLLTTRPEHDIFYLMVKAKRIIQTLMIVVILLSLASVGILPITAQEDEEPPVRQTTIVVTLNEYEWWLIRWRDNQIVCQIFSEHENVPVDEEILKACGRAVFDEWKLTPPCPEASQGGVAAMACPGMYLFLAGFQTGQRTVIVDLPPPSVWISLSGCALIPPVNLCPQIPSLLLSGEEPLPNEHITAIHAVVDDVPYVCEAEFCEIPLRPTPPAGIQIEFWAESSFGDTSERYAALVRVLDSGFVAPPGVAGWYVDILSTQWRDGRVESCAQVWRSFPPAGGPPFWLSTPTQDQLLASDEPYHYLAGRLIDQHLVDAADCPGNGLLANGYANACGLEKARSMVELWQNQFDTRILTVAQETNLPAQLLKNLFAQESQFWPGVFRVAREYGFGQMTDMGADTILLWNASFFKQFCPLVLDQSACARGYLRLRDNERAILRGALAVRANADCPECPTGIDLTHADYSVMIFAQSLLANCEQVSRTIYNATQSTPGTVSSYEDLWRFTLANYHAGPGCLAFAIHTTWNYREPLDWEHVSANFTEACQGAVTYIALIAR